MRVDRLPLEITAAGDGRNELKGQEGKPILSKSASLRQTKRSPDERQLCLPLRINASLLILKRLGMTSDEKHLYRVFLLAAGDDLRRLVFMPQRSLAEAMSTSISTVERAIRGLKKRELIMKRTRMRTGRRCGHWQLCAAALWELAGVDFSARESPQGEGLLNSETRHTDGSAEIETRHTDGFGALQLRNEVPHQNGERKIKPMNHDGFCTEAGTRWAQRRLTRADLLNSRTIYELFLYAVSQHKRRANEHDEFEFYCLCVHCAEDGKDPGKLLTACVFQSETARPTGPQEDRGRRLMLERQTDQRPPRPPELTSALATVFGSAEAPVAESDFDRHRNEKVLETVRALRQQAESRKKNND